MKLIKVLQDKNYAELRDYVDGRISSIVVGRIVERKRDILNKLRGIVSEDETIEVTIKNDKDKDKKGDEKDKESDSKKDDSDEKEDKDEK